MSTSNININNINKINKLYNTSTLFEKYGLDVWITIIVIIIFLFVTSYFYILNHLHSLRMNWTANRCNPLYMPFAGIINNKTNKSNFDYALDNFSYCINNMAKTTAGYAMDPVNYIIDSQTEIFQMLSNTFNSLRAFLSYLRNAFMLLYQDIVTRLINICIPLLNIFVKLKDSISKLVGILTSTLFAYVLVYKIMKIYILNIGIVTTLEIFIPMLLTWIATFLVALMLLWIPFVGWAIYNGMFWGAIVPLGVILTLIFVVLCMIIIFTNQVYTDISQGLPPHPPVI